MRIMTIKFQVCRKYIFFLLCITFILAICQTTALAEDLNISLMKSTFMIVGKSQQDQTKLTVGTIFFIGRPLKSDPKQGYNTMVTAAHVLDEIVGDDATIFLRKKESDGSYKKVPLRIKIRDNGKPLFVRHANADVVAMYLMLPKDFGMSFLSSGLLADDKVFEKYEIHPGDQLLSLGYPFAAEANEAGFPVLRSGIIASYPITPAKTVKTFLFDFRVFDGNSGGPVYMNYSSRIYQNVNHLDENVQYIAGLVSQQWKALPEFNSQPLSLAVIVPAQFIVETINLLPESP